MPACIGCRRCPVSFSSSRKPASSRVDLHEIVQMTLSSAKNSAGRDQDYEHALVLQRPAIEEMALAREGVDAERRHKPARPFEVVIHSYTTLTWYSRYMYPNYSKGTRHCRSLSAAVEQYGSTAVSSSTLCLWPARFPSFGPVHCTRYLPMGSFRSNGRCV